MIAEAPEAKGRFARRAATTAKKPATKAKKTTKSRKK